MPSEPAFVMRFIEEHGGGAKEYVVLKLQALTLLVFLLTLLSIFSAELWPRAVLAFLVVTQMLVIAFQLKGFEDRDTIAFFFGALSVFAFLMSLSFLLVQRFDAWIAGGFFLLLLAILIAFRLFFARSHTFGEVLTAGDGWAVVRVGYDVAAGVPNGYYAVRAPGTVKRGRISKLSVKQSFGGSARPWEIIG